MTERAAGEARPIAPSSSAGSGSGRERAACRAARGSQRHLQTAAPAATDRSSAFGLARKAASATVAGAVFSRVGAR